MKPLPLIILLSLLLSGCVITQPLSYSNLKSPESFLSKSDSFVKQQHWGKAQLLLEEGIFLFPEDLSLKKALSKVKNEWQIRKNNLEDWILVYEIEGMLLTRPLLVSMSQSDPLDYPLKRRLRLFDSSLNSKRELLLICTRRQLELSLKLAKRCIEAAQQIHLSIQVQTLLSQIQNKQSSKLKTKQKKEALSIAEARSVILMKARSHLQESFYYEAVKVLEPLSLSDKDDQEVNILMEEALTGRDLQMLQLISHGDRLYREEHIQEALEIWEQAVKLDPTNIDVTLRINRAKKVLETLQEIRAKE